MILWTGLGLNMKEKRQNSLILTLSICVQRVLTFQKCKIYHKDRHEIDTIWKKLDCNVNDPLVNAVSK